MFPHVFQGDLFEQLGNYPSALQQHARVLSVYERELPSSHPDRIRAMGTKACALRLLCRLDESLALFKAALKLGRRVFVEDSDSLIVLEENMAHTLDHLGDSGAAAEVYERLIVVQERSPLYGPSHEQTWETRSKLGRTLVELGNVSAAIPLLRDALAAYDGMGLGPEHPRLGAIPQQYAIALLRAGRPAEAVPLLHRSIAYHECKHGPHNYFIPADLLRLAEAYGQMGRGFGERLSLLDRAVSIRELSVGRDKDQDAGQRTVVLQACAECYEEAGHLDEAEERWAKCVAAFEKVRGGRARGLVLY